MNSDAFKSIMKDRINKCNNVIKIDDLDSWDKPIDKNKLEDKKKAVKEACEYILSILDEGVTKNELVFNNKKVKLEIDKNTDEKDVYIFYNKFSSIMKFVAKKFYEYYKEFCKDDEPVKSWKNSSDILNNIVINKISLFPMKSSKYDSFTNIHINCDLSSNILNKIHDDHIPSIDACIKDHSIKMTEEFFDCYWDG